MFIDHAKIIHPSASVEEISGRKKKKKIIYIAKKIDFPFQEKYQFHFFGPYSEELTLRIEELCEMGYLNESKEKKNGYYQYCYSITEAGEGFLHLYRLDMPALQECLIDMNEQNARFLELVSTILFFDSLSKEDVIEKIETVKSKQKYTLAEIEDAYAYIERLAQKAKAH